MKNIYIFILTLFCHNLFGQNETSVTGGTATGTGGTATYTVGLPLYTNQTNSSFIILQGVQQPKEFLTISYKKSPDLTHISVYPNPANSFFFIQLDANNNNLMNYKLISSDGKKVAENIIDDALTTVNTTDLAAGVYFLQIFSDNKLLSSTKILKIIF
ncbi:MAG: T9SS type A sorting domain-containing protein [Bacteroidia bacterium]|nr:T9SS type A sorting domain-containing protein [Bacteroidia bacterium]